MDPQLICTDKKKISANGMNKFKLCFLFDDGQLFFYDIRCPCPYSLGFSHLRMRGTMKRREKESEIWKCSPIQIQMWKFFSFISALRLFHMLRDFRWILPSASIQNGAFYRKIT